MALCEERFDCVFVCSVLFIGRNTLWTVYTTGQCTTVCLLSFFSFSTEIETVSLAFVDQSIEECLLLHDPLLVWSHHPFERYVLRRESVGI